MKYISTLFIFLSISLFQSYSQTAIIAGKFNTDYIIWDTTNLNSGKEVARGYKGDSCILISYHKSIIGSEWLLVLREDTIGYAMVEFIDFKRDSLYNLMNQKLASERKSRSLEYIQVAKSAWLSKRELNRQNLIKYREVKSVEFKKYVAQHTIFVLSHSFPEDKYLKYPGFEVTILNPKANKTIKYLWFTIEGYNPVNDIEGTKTVKAIGPVEAMRMASYKFESVIASKVIEFCKISAIKIQYIDGTLANVPKKEIEHMDIKASVLLNYIEELK